MNQEVHFAHFTMQKNGTLITIAHLSYILNAYIIWMPTALNIAVKLSLSL